MSDDVRNYEEYRAEALASLGEDYTVEDLRNEERFRSKVLDGLGMSYETEDLVNFEKYRLKVLQGIAGGGGGSSAYTLLATDEYDANTTTTSDVILSKEIALGEEYWTSDKIIYIQVRDKQGRRNGYFYGSDVYIINDMPANGDTSSSSTGTNERKPTTYAYNNGKFVQSSAGYGVYGYAIRPNGNVVIATRYNATKSYTINSTYTVKVYALDWADDGNPFII